VVGYSRLDSPGIPTHAFAWTASGGKVDLATLPGDLESFARGTSFRQVVGLSTSPSGGSARRAFTWTRLRGMIEIPTPSNDADATHVNRGKVVGQFVAATGGFRTFLWTAAGGFVDVTPADFTFGARPAGIDAAGRIAVTDDQDDIGTTRSAVIVLGPQDADGDGVLDTDDRCPNSIRTPTVVIEDCGSGAPNRALHNGCGITDAIEQCATDARNHDRFVSCVGDLTESLKRAGVITGRQKAAIQRCAVRSDIP
jgi:hypothetical protein